MPLPSETLATYQAIGNREDLTDIVDRISPVDTPFYSGISKSKADGVLHEWQIQELASVDTANAVLEGDDATTDAANITTRKGNRCQISDKVARVSGTQEAVKHAGRGSEMDEQEMIKALELKRDMESILIGVNQTQVAGDTTTARKLASVLSWIVTNDDHVGTSPTTSGTVTRVDGTQRAFTEAQLKNVLSLCWTEGGEPGTIMTGAFNKQVFSTFTGRATPMEDTKAKKITASVSAYESDFGTLKVVANRFQRSRDVFVLDMDKWEVAFLNGRRNISIPLAKTGDSERRQILSEYTLVSKNEKASGAVYDLTTS